MSLPSITSSSLAPSLTVTPSNMGHFRTTFSPTVHKTSRQPVVFSARFTSTPTEVSDLDGLSVTGDNRVDGEMGVDQLHLVLVTLGDTGDHVGDHRLDSSETSDVLSVSVPNGEPGLGTLGTLDLRETNLSDASSFSNTDRASSEEQQGVGDCWRVRGMSRAIDWRRKDPRIHSAAMSFKPSAPHATLHFLAFPFSLLSYPTPSVHPSLLLIVFRLVRDRLSSIGGPTCCSSCSFPLQLTIWMSIWMCLTALVRVPRGPVTVTIRDLILMSTPSGMDRVSLAVMSFILTV